jgi:hypothetical protein
LLGNGDGSFQPAVNFPAGNAPISVVVADFNHDGFPDLAVANEDAQGTVSILLGNGDGTFQAAVSYPAGMRTFSVAVGDFNGDGILDLVAPNAGDFSNTQGGSVSILLGNGDGTFQAPVDYVAGVSPGSVGVGDFNADGILDLAVTNYEGTVSVLLGRGDGSFQSPANYSVGTIILSQAALAVRDINDDGIADLAVASGSGVRVLLGNGDGTFQTTPISYVAGVGAFSVAVGDFNRDGLPDGGVSILINDGKWLP